MLCVVFLARVTCNWLISSNIYILKENLFGSVFVLLISYQPNSNIAFNSTVTIALANIITMYNVKWFVVTRIRSSRTIHIHYQMYEPQYVWLISHHCHFPFVLRPIEPITSRVDAPSLCSMI